MARVRRRVDGLEVAEDGTVQAMPGLRLPWEYCVTRQPVGAEIDVEVSREGKTSSVRVPLVAEPRLVAFHDSVDATPSYVIVGGLVFLELSIPLIDAGLFDNVWDPSSSGAILTQLQAKRTQPDETIVLLASILESELTISYDACVGRQLTKFNGSPVKHLRALAAAVTNAGSAPFLKFEFGQWCAVLETAQNKKAEADVLRAHDIASWCSADVDPHGDSVLLGCVTAFSLRPKGKQQLPSLS